MNSNPEYIQKLNNIDFFPCSSFYNIALDWPRFQFKKSAYQEETDIDLMREIGRLTLQNYAKRNSFYSYIQSQGTVVNALTIMTYKNALGMGELDVNFWLYTQIFEHILPVGFYCQLLEP